MDFPTTLFRRLLRLNSRQVQLAHRTLQVNNLFQGAAHEHQGDNWKESHVAPIPWVSQEAAQAIIGKQLDEESAQLAGDAAVARATPLSNNDYKVQLARTAVKRALLRAVDKLEGGL